MVPLHGQIERYIPERPTGHLTDAAGVVDAASAARIESVAKALRERTGAELAVVTLPSIGEYEPADVARTIGRRWGVGAAAELGDPTRNAGVVVLLVPKGPDRPGRLRIETGRGIEGVITDATAGRIRDAMRPQLAAGEYGPGLVTGVEALAGLIAQRMGVRDSTIGGAPVAAGGGMSPLVMLLLLFVIFAIVVSIAGSRSRHANVTRGRSRRRGPTIYWGPGPWIGGSGGWGGGYGGGGGFGGFGGGGGFSGGGAGGDF